MSVGNSFVGLDIKKLHERLKCEAVLIFQFRVYQPFSVENDRFSESPLKVLFYAFHFRHILKVGPKTLWHTRSCNNVVCHESPGR